MSKFKVGDVIYSKESGSVIKVLDISKSDYMYVWKYNLYNKASDSSFFTENPGPHPCPVDLIDNNFNLLTKLHKALI